MLAAEDQRLLFRLARDAISRHLDGAPPPPLPRDRPALVEVRGVFVTLHRGDDLRGCIGHSSGRLPLCEGVRSLAVSAAQDQRFDPVTRDEVERLHVEISVLSPVAPVKVCEIDPTRHGLTVRLGPRAGLLLPQVAQERGWDAMTFLEHTCRKAGLPPDAWRHDGAELRAFTCDVYANPPDGVPA